MRKTKLLFICVTLLLVLFLCACGDKQNTPNPDDNTSTNITDSVKEPNSSTEPTKVPDSDTEPAKAPDSATEPTKAADLTAEPTKAPDSTANPTKAPDSAVKPTELPVATPTAVPTPVINAKYSWDLPEKLLGTYVRYTGTYCTETFKLSNNSINCLYHEYPFYYTSENTEIKATPSGENSFTLSTEITTDGVTTLVPVYTINYYEYYGTLSLSFSTYREPRADDEWGEEMNEDDYWDENWYDEGEDEDSVYFEGTYVTSLNGIPLENYEELDDKGTWGAIPYTPEIANLLLSGAGDDYVIYYNDSQEAYISVEDENTYYYTCYGMCEYDEQGLTTGFNRWLYQSVKPEERELVFKYITEVYEAFNYERIGDFLYCTVKEDPDYVFYESKLSHLDGNVNIVYGKHCTYWYGDYSYISKPISLEEGLHYNEIGEAMNRMNCYTTVDATEENSVCIFGDAFYPEIEVCYGGYEGFYLYRFNAIELDGETLVAFSSVSDDNYIYVVEFTLNNDILHTRILSYKYNKAINISSYKTYKAVSDNSFDVNFVSVADYYN